MPLVRPIQVPVDRLDAEAYVIPTDAPESDGTLSWAQTTLVVVELGAGDVTGLGYTYGDTSVAELIRRHLSRIVEGMDVMAVGAAWMAMVRSIRNLGRPGIASMAISAVDVALWDAKAKLLRVPLSVLLDPVRDAVPLYGSGGFTSYSLTRLADQLSSWAADGFSRVKIKVGREPAEDRERLAVAREAIGPEVELFIDANGAYTPQQARRAAQEAAAFDVRWFEEPVSSDDLAGLRFVRAGSPAGMEIAAGEYGYDLPYFERMIEAGAVDVLQADATRCGGVTGMLAVAPLCEARSMALSAHTAPNLHASICCAIRPLAHLEYFHDHARIERRLFDGALDPIQGTLRPDRTRPGLGLEFKRTDAAEYEQ